MTKNKIILKDIMVGLTLKIICPKCGAKEGENDPDFGYPPACIGEIGVHATCYKCNHVFEINNP